jgi:hypothetical protein
LAVATLLAAWALGIAGYLQPEDDPAEPSAWDDRVLDLPRIARAETGAGTVVALGGGGTGGVG